MSIFYHDDHRLQVASIGGGPVGEHGPPRKAHDPEAARRHIGQGLDVIDARIDVVHMTEERPGLAADG